MKLTSILRPFSRDTPHADPNQHARTSTCLHSDTPTHTQTHGTVHTHTHSTNVPNVIEGATTPRCWGGQHFATQFLWLTSERVSERLRARACNRLPCLVRRFYSTLSQTWCHHHENVAAVRAWHVASAPCGCDENSCVSMRCEMVGRWWGWFRGYAVILRSIVICLCWGRKIGGMGTHRCAFRWTRARARTMTPSAWRGVHMVMAWTCRMWVWMVVGECCLDILYE